MPSKNKRMASRQSRVRERNRRRGGRRTAALGGTAATQEIRRGVWRAPDGGGETMSAGASATAAEGVAAAQPAAVSASQSEAITRRRSARSRTPSEPLPMYAHLGSELRRIAALTALTAVALAVLTFFLR